MPEYLRVASYDGRDSNSLLQQELINCLVTYTFKMGVLEETDSFLIIEPIAWCVSLK